LLKIRPSLLPALKGRNGIKDTFTYGTKLAGVTIHYVNENMDAGPIITQEAFKVKDDETLESLEERIHKLEHKMYPAVIQQHVSGKLKVTGRKVQYH
jgi:phosphoribosylglycinamide formyltransferase-1